MNTGHQLSGNMFKKMAVENPEKYPARMGQPWEDDETITLLKAARAKQPLDEIARSHERTVGSISSRLHALACDYHFNENRSIEEIMRFTGLPKESIINAITKRQQQENLKDKKKDSTKKTQIRITDVPDVKETLSNALLIEIRDLLKELVELQRQKL